MNVVLTIVKKSVGLIDNELKIYYGGFITTQADFDIIVNTTMKYLDAEGFLEDHCEIDQYHVFDYLNNQIFRENCKI
jgi:hypothetical protein